MKTTANKKSGKDKTFERIWEESWTYIKTVVDVLRESVLILDENLHVIAANESFYRTFQVEPKDTEKKLIYELGSGQWNIPSLKKLIEDILPKNTFFKGFEVTHVFPSIGRKVMILNARRIYRGSPDASSFPPIILLAMEDVTELMSVAEMLALHTNQFEEKIAKRTSKLESLIDILQKEIGGIKKRSL